MKKSPLKAFIVLLLIAAGATPVRAGTGPDTGRWPPHDQGLLDRIVVGRYLQGDAMEVIGLTSADGPLGVKALYYRGEAMRSLGLFSGAAKAYEGAIGMKSPDEPLWNASLIRYIQLMEPMPELPPPGVPRNLDARIKGKAALYLGSLLLGEGREERGVGLLQSIKNDGGDVNALAAASRAQSHAASGRWAEAASILASFKTRETTSVTDLTYLLRGYDNLETGDLRLARSAFLAIPPSSPYAPEAIHGMAWVLIRKGDLSGASVRLQELIHNYPDSPAAREGVVDLALCYRNLGLYDNATQLLTRESKHLAEVRGWLESLNASDFKSGSDLIALLSSALHGVNPAPVILKKTPGFILQWLIRASRDPQVRRISALMEGGIKLQDEAQKLQEKNAGAVELLGDEIRFTEKLLREVNRTRDLLKSARNRLPSFREDVIHTLEKNSLRDFAPEEAFKLLRRIRAAQGRLESVKATAGKVRGFNRVIESIKNSIPGSAEEKQINLIRKNAYEGLVSSRSALRRIRSSLQALEGRVWLAAKGEAMGFERESSARVSAEMARVGLLLEKTERAVNLLLERKARLVQARDDLDRRVKKTVRATEKSVSAFVSNAAALRSARLLKIAENSAAKLKDADARAVFTAADIEIYRMEKALQTIRETAR